MKIVRHAILFNAPVKLIITRAFIFLEIFEKIVP